MLFFLPLLCNELMARVSRLCGLKALGRYLQYGELLEMRDPRWSRVGSVSRLDCAPPIIICSLCYTYSRGIIINTIQSVKLSSSTVSRHTQMANSWFYSLTTASSYLNCASCMIPQFSSNWTSHPMCAYEWVAKAIVSTSFRLNKCQTLRIEEYIPLYRSSP